MEQYYISDYCTIRNGKVTKNGKEVYKGSISDLVKEFTKGIYRSLALNYPKFYKMDELCKLGFLATEVLLQGKKELSEDTALLFMNRASSLDTDRKHLETIKDKDNYFPSPAVFVYTLPNIILGEVSIRHKLKSENAFFVSEKFDADLLTQYAKILMDTKKASNVICGWVDLDTNKYDVFLTLISRKGKKSFTKKELNNLYCS